MIANNLLHDIEEALQWCKRQTYYRADKAIAALNGMTERKFGRQHFTDSFEYFHEGENHNEYEVTGDPEAFEDLKVYAKITLRNSLIGKMHYVLDEDLGGEWFFIPNPDYGFRSRELIYISALVAKLNENELARLTEET